MSNDCYAVLYTDGGCRQKEGVGGWGVHGYTYNSEINKRSTGLKGWSITPGGYLKLSSLNYDQEYTKAWKVTPFPLEDFNVDNVNVLQYIDLMGSVPLDSTNNQTELMAAIKALEKVIELNCQYTLIFTDSKYIQEGYEKYLDKWIKKGWTNSKGQPLSNKALWQTVRELRSELAQKGLKVNFEWIKGHSDHLGNDKADKNAEKGVIAGTKGESIVTASNTVPTSYWKPKSEINRLFSHTRWYFNSANGKVTYSPTGHAIYHLGHHGKDDDFLAKRMSDSAYSVLYLNHPDPILELIKKEIHRMDYNRNHSFMIGRLDFIHRPSTYTQLLENKTLFLKSMQNDYHQDRLDLYSPDDQLLAKELRPARLAMNLIDIMQTLEGLLQKSMNPHQHPEVTLTSITADLYLIEEKKGNLVKKLHPDITNSVKSLTLSLFHPLGKDRVKLPLTLGMDLPTRNTLAAIAPRNPEVSIITWKESNRAFRYASVVYCEGDVGIYSGYYSNIHLLL